MYQYEFHWKMSVLLDIENFYKNLSRNPKFH
jgi:hypothetical protein